MKLPEELTTVTPFSKVLALFLFIMLPIIGFLLGIQYQAQVQISEKDMIQPTITITPTKTEPTDFSSFTETNQIKAEECYKKFKKDYAEGTGSYIPNPASVFCQCMGGELEVTDTAKGQVGMCNINGQIIDEWKYFDQMNPYENSFSPSPLGTKVWQEYCQKNKQSIYCPN